MALVLAAGASASAGSSSDGSDPVRVVVVLHDHVDDPRQAASDLARRHDGQVTHVYEHALKGFAGTFPRASLDGMQRDRRVDWVELDRVFTTQAEPDYETGVDRIDSDLNTTYGAGGSDGSVAADIAVLDTGVSHPDVEVVKRYDCTGGGPFNSGCTEGSGDDGHGHGTHVAGTAAAIKNGSDVIGVAPGAPVWSIKVLNDNGSGWTSWIVAGIDVTAANSGTVAVANMSLGGSGSDDGNCGSDDGDAMHQAICAAVDEGVVYVVAAGNSSDDAANHVPAAYDEVITVSALADFDGKAGAAASPTCRDDEDDTLANFSNYGADVDLAAPGVCITSTWNDGGLNTISGTSMASPHVAGLAAMYIQHHGKPTTKTGVDDLRQALIDGGTAQGDTCGFVDDSGDGYAEPLAFANATNVDGDGSCEVADSSSTDGSPSVSFVNPSDGETVSGTVTVQIDASDGEDADDSLTVEWRVDGGDWQTATYNSTSGYYEGSWDTTGVSDGDHTLESQATDSDSNTTSQAITVTVDNTTDTGSGSSYVWDVAFAQKDYGPGGSFKDLMTTPTISWDSDGDSTAESSDEEVADATVELVLTRDTDGDGVFECGTDDDCWTFSGTTGSDGTVSFTLKRAPTGNYQAEVTAVTHSTYTWTSSLDADNPATYTLQ